MIPIIAKIICLLKFEKFGVSELMAILYKAARLMEIKSNTEPNKIQSKFLKYDKYFLKGINFLILQLF